MGIYTSSIRGRVSPFASAVYPHYKGIVKWFNNAKGYGFLGHDGGADVFVHYSSIKREGYKTLKEGDPVEFSREPRRVANPKRAEFNSRGERLMSAAIRGCHLCRTTTRSAARKKQFRLCSGEWRLISADGVFS